MPWAWRPRRPATGDPAPDAPVAPPPADDLQERMPPPSRMRKERRMLARRRELEIRDVGGLAVEMARRDRFRPELIYQRANDVLRLEERMHELDGLLMAVAAAPRGMRSIPTCRCGAPLLPGSHFCSHCGRPSGIAPPVLTCTHCGQPLPADTNFCAFCGHSVAAERPAAENLDDTAVPRWSSSEES